MNIKRRSMSTTDARRKVLGASLGGLAISAALLALIAVVAYAAPILILDDGGPDDEVGQKDLSQLTVDSDGLPSSLAVTWNWDDTAWSGGNTGDACSLYDTDGDGNANYALCVGVGGDPASYQYSVLWTCSNKRSDRCTAPNSNTSTFNSTCSAGVVNDSDPFRSDPSHTDFNGSDALNDDAVASCSVDMDDVGGGISATLLNVCSYESASPTSNPEECVITPESGFLTIVKVATGGSADFVFNASAPSTGGVSSWTITGSGSVALIPYAPTTTLDLNEDIPSLWQLDAASCVIQPSTSTGTPDALPFAGPASKGVQNLTIQSGLETVCTFNDSLRRRDGALIVKKLVINNDGGTKVATDFSFSVNVGTATAFLQDGGDPLKGLNNLTVDEGTYSVVEPSVAGYTTSYDNCTDVFVPDGGSATCTITNDDQQAYITVEKVVNNDHGGTAQPDDFLLTLDGSATTSGTPIPVDPGTYTAGETPLSGYTFDGFSGDCDSNGETTVALGESKTCTLTNTDIAPTITIIKNTHGTPTEFTFNIAGPSASTPSITPVGDPGTGTTGPIAVDAGSYTVDEQGPPAGWTLTDITCDAGSAGPDTNADGIPNSWNFTLALGDHVTCTFTDSAALTTRTQGFWATHTALANAVWNGEPGAPVGSTPVVGSPDEFLCGRQITAIALPGDNILMGGFWSNIARTSDRTKRSALDQARMQLLQQYLAAVLNVHAFGSGSPTLLSNARAAYCGTDISVIKAQIGVLGAFNSSGDSQAFTPGASATAQLSKEQADIGFWDATE